MVDIVSGWSDDRNVYLIERDGERVTYRRLPARWSAWMRGLNDDDRRTLSRTRDVTAVTPEGELTRIDFRGRWARTEVTTRVKEAIKGRKLEINISGSDEELNDPIFSAAVLEGDVNPLRRLLSDVSSINVSATPRVGYLDLETDSRVRFQDAVEGHARVLAWSAIGHDGRKASAILEEENDAAERALLSGLFAWLDSVDVVLAWNGDAFDFLVLENRLIKLRIKVADRPVEWRRWCWLDQMQVFRKYNQAHESGEERTSFALNAIAKHLLGKAKTAFDTRHTYEAWKAGGESRAKLLAYNEDDVALMPGIEEKTGFVALHLAVCAVTRCLPDSSSLAAIAQGDGYMLALGAKHGWRFPGRPDFDENHQAFEGAYVMEPRLLGAIDDVHVCDFAGLYPSIIRTWNMSPDTLAMDGVQAGGALSKLPGRNVYFRTDRRGLFPLALDEIVAQRGVYTKRADDAEPGSDDWTKYKRLSSAYKIVANSFYGILGSPFSRFFDRRIAEGVTNTGKWLIQHSAEVFEREGVRAFYADTDSLLAQGDAGKFAALVKTLNDSWPGIAADLGCDRSFVKLEYEKSFRRLLLVSAKRYAAKYSLYKGKPAPPDMKPEIKGLEYKRGDSLRLARELQFQTIERLLADGPIPTASEIREMVAPWRERVLHGEVTVDELALSQSVKDLDEYRERFTSGTCTGKIPTGQGKKTRPCGYTYASGTALTRIDPEAFPTITADESGEDAPTEHVIRKHHKEPVPVGEEDAPWPILEATICPKCKSPRKIASAPVHVRVARLMAARGEQVTGGTRIEYLIVRPKTAEERGPDDEEDEDDTKIQAIPARDPGALDRVDRDAYWDKRIWPPTQRLLEVVYKGSEWRDTKSRRAKVIKDAEKVANKGKVADLPLFIAPEVSLMDVVYGPGPTVPNTVYGPGPTVPDTVYGPGHQEPAGDVGASPGMFDAFDPEPGTKANVEPVRRRRRAVQSPSVEALDETLPRVRIRMNEGSGARGGKRLVAVQAAIQAFPGARPVSLVVEVDGAEVTIPTGLGIRVCPEAVASVERLLGPGCFDV